MATDGVKIINGDLAHDTYWGFMDMYDEGIPLEKIKASIEQGKEEYNDFEYEIFITAYALALWETGTLTDLIKQQVRNVIDKGVGVKVWKEEVSEAEGKAREWELALFWKKINTAKRTVRKRKSYRRIVNLLFSEGDVLVFQLPDGSYCATLVLLISQGRGQCSYEFAKLTYRDTERPDLIDIKNYYVVGRKVSSGVEIEWANLLNEGMHKISEQGGIDAIVRREAERTCKYFIGIDVIGVEHKTLKGFANRFERIGQLYFKPESKLCGLQGGETSFEGFQQCFDSLMSDLTTFKSELFPIQQFLAE
ncbi:hypothetical protein QNI16_11235 [Cytophagaceae bacterium YF14B1]|uniref:Uncharacterized protein n=1 Tax=Xanthocytophaga flava TaxID=3048013 RepID=A0AAE3QQV1_9BACT|nr:hypothetical protein [Xanthocytophaga flavus]MDJ1481058.1 hypothetical protein [Xanthocytophaga flavus]